MLQQQDLQYQSTRGTEINQLNQRIQQIDTERNAYFTQMQQKEQEIQNLKNTLAETMSVAEKNHERLIKEKEDQANKEHNRLMMEKSNEMQNIIQKYQDMETKYNLLEQKYSHQIGQYKKDVSTEAFRLAGQITKEKDEEIQQLTDELNRFRYKPGESLGQLGGMIHSSRY